MIQTNGSYPSLHPTCAPEADGCLRCELPPEREAPSKDVGDAWLREVLEADALHSLFQPIVSASTGKVYGYEALLRARNPRTGEPIEAGPLFAASERLKLQHVLDQRARKTAIRSAAALQPQVGPDCKFFVNFMPNTIYDPAICLRTTMEAVEAVGMDPDRFVFEVTEGERIRNFRNLSRVLDFYRGKGVCTAIDDMGAGNTSVDYAISLQPDYVKIDRSALIKADKTFDGADDLSVVIQTMQLLGCAVIAEGIETVEQLRSCRAMGVDYVQGYLIGRPENPPQVNFLPEWYS